VPAPALTLEFANLDYSSFAFSEGSFSFIHNSGSDDFQLTYASEYVDSRTDAALGPAQAMAINGNISGAFTLGTINNGRGMVSVTGTLTLVDPEGQMLSVNLNWFGLSCLWSRGVMLNGHIV